MGDGGPIALFVYGTLMRGHGNHHWLAGARFGGERRLLGARLYNLGPFPMAVTVDGGEADPRDKGELGDGVWGDGVWGELWWIDAACLERLDRLEGHPRLYERRFLALADGQEAWVYLGRPRQVRSSPALSSGRWRGAGTGGAPPG